MVKYRDDFLFYPTSYGNAQVVQALISVTVESALLGSGIETYQKVVQLLEKKYHGSMPDCCDHPEYLDEILQVLDTKSRSRVMESIKKGLGEFSYDESISKFIAELNI